MNDAAGTLDAEPVLVHDYLLVLRGAERSFLALCDLWPDAPVATLLCDRRVFGARLAGHRVVTSRLQRFGARQRTFKALLPAMPAAAQRLPVAGHRLVVSSSSAFAHGVRPDPGATHVCYCYTPFRYAWYEREAGVAQAPAILRPAVRRTLAHVRAWDHAAAQRATHYVAISRLSQQRIARYWGVEAPIVHPPVEIDRFTTSDEPPGERLLVVGELVRHKRVELALQAARRARAPITVVGGGSDEARLRRLYGLDADFVGRVDDARLATLYGRARALVMPNVEEFGITAVEAQAAGRPVIAADAGGAQETVVDGRTGLLVPPDDVDALAAAMTDSLLDRVSADECRTNAQRFSVQAFQTGMLEQVRRATTAR